MCSAKTSLSLPREFGVLGFNRKAILPETLRLSLTIVITAVALLAGLLLVSTQPALAQTETVLYSFANNGTDGYQPYAALTKGKSGTLYGTTDLGGTHGYGTVFELTKNKCETPLLNFNAGKKGGGEYPYFAGLVIDKAGNLYGTTSFGGAHNFGAVFVLTPSGAETVLYSFGSQTNDGAYPFGGVVLDKSGNLYGTTTIGGVHNKGTVFKVSPAGAETVLYSFAGGTDGCNPDAGVVLGKKNVLYGTTIACGSSNNGIVFAVTQAGVETVMHTFNLDGTDGILPYAGIVLDKAGDLYGTTYQGGRTMPVRSTSSLRQEPRLSFTASASLEPTDIIPKPRWFSTKRETSTARRPMARTALARSLRSPQAEPKPCSTASSPMERMDTIPTEE
jgi:uncharacterized repeat protein (TIGR03803 family)